MHQAPASFPLDLPRFESSINLPYRLTPGLAMGSFLAELAAHRLIGTRCARCNRVEVPAQDVCRCGHDELERVELSGGGSITGFTQTPECTIGLVRLDGTDTDLLHRLLGAADAGWAVGQRVQPVWADKAVGSMLDLAGFTASTAPVDAARPRRAEQLREPLDSFPTSLSLRYRHARGPYYGRLFDEMQTSGRILGIRCPQCQSVLLPPRELCDVCYVRTGTWADVADTGVLQAFSIIYLSFVGQRREPPYVYAEIMLDGASTKMIHVLDGVDLEQAPTKLKPGVRVRAVWRDTLKGSVDDISHFELFDPL